MSKRSILVDVFKLHGLTWMHRRYKRNGVWRNCYAPKWGEMDPVFNRDPLSRKQLAGIIKTRLNKRAQP